MVGPEVFVIDVCGFKIVIRKDISGCLIYKMLSSKYLNIFLIKSCDYKCLPHRSLDLHKAYKQ